MRPNQRNPTCARFSRATSERCRDSATTTLRCRVCEYFTRRTSCVAFLAPITSHSGCTLVKSRLRRSLTLCNPIKSRIIFSIEIHNAQTGDWRVYYLIVRYFCSSACVCQGARSLKRYWGGQLGVRLRWRRVHVQVAVKFSGHAHTRFHASEHKTVAARRTSRHADDRSRLFRRS